MKRYRKKPIVIEAVQFDGANAQEIIEWANEENKRYVIHAAPRVLQIVTIEGCLVALAGDWIIRGIEGEYYPCKDSIFKATYEEVPCINSLHKG